MTFSALAATGVTRSAPGPAAATGAGTVSGLYGVTPEVEYAGGQTAGAAAGMVTPTEATLAGAGTGTAGPSSAITRTGLTTGVGCGSGLGWTLSVFAGARMPRNRPMIVGGGETAAALSVTSGSHVGQAGYPGSPSAVTLAPVAYPLTCGLTIGRAFGSSASWRTWMRTNCIVGGPEGSTGVGAGGRTMPGFSPE